VGSFAVLRVAGVLNARFGAASMCFVVSSALSSSSSEFAMLETPFNFEPGLTPEDYQKLGQLSLRWSHTEHVIGNCLKTMLRLTEDEAIAIVFPLSLEQRLSRMRELAKLAPLNAEAAPALVELLYIMPGIQYVRNNVAHAVVIMDPDEKDHRFHLRSKQRSLTKAQIFDTEEITNYAAHVAYSLRFALGVKDNPGARHALPDRPEIPEFLRASIPIRKKGDRPAQCPPGSSPE
jgi:hypothetical protein